MSKLKVLKQRAARGLVGIVKLRDGWHIATGVNGGWSDGPFTKREATFKASRWAMPSKPIVCTMTSF